MYKRIVIKVGTKVLSREDGSLDVKVMAHLVQEIVALKNKGMEIVLVSSGAVGAGRGLVAPRRRNRTANKQVLAAVGQVKLMSTYAALLGKYDTLCAQVLATKEDFRDRGHYLNMRSCFEQLLLSGVVAIVNENDVVATTELLFTDNDELAGLVASQLGADAVIILTSVDGFMNGDPKNKHAKVVAEIDCDSIDRFRDCVFPDKTAFGRGGMLTKFDIAKKLALSGVEVHLANGKAKNVITDIISGKRVGTKFASGGKSSNLKRRIAYSEGLCKGSVRINRGAEDLLISKTKIMSLLPVGVTEVAGDFKKGDIVEIVGPSKKLGFGIAEYDAGRARELMGTKHARPVIHYDHMFIGV